MKNLEKLLKYYISEELYEKAVEIQKLIDQKNATQKNNCSEEVVV